MRLACEWIREYAPTRLPPAEIARRLTAAGLSVERLERAGDEHLLDVDVATNRPDCMNLYGLCREVAAHAGARLRPIRPKVREAGPAVASRVGIEVRERRLCRRYSARVILGVNVTASPEWMQRRLVAMGLRPINLVVDATNYVLMELGQPLHAFDLDRIAGPRIVVRLARAGETLRTLDGVERRLTTEMLVIADRDRPVAIAGVMGGQDTEIGPAARNVLLESAWFDPVSVRRTARALGLRTEASHRFERGADIEITGLALDRCCELLLGAGPGEVARGTLDAYAGRRRSPGIRISAERTRRLLGDRVPHGEIPRRLRGLGFRVRPAGAGRWTVAAPSFRSDIESEVDLIEEVARCRGYDRIPARLPLLAGRGQGRDRGAASVRRIRAILAAAGFQEVINLAMVDPDRERRFAGEPDDRVPIRNPLSDRASVLRRTLLPGLVQNVAFNRNHGQEDLMLFEVGRGFRRAEPGTPPAEALLLGIAVTGRAEPPHWARPAGPFTWHHLKGVFQAVVDRIGVRDVRLRRERALPLEDDAGAALECGGRTLGIFGRLRRDLAAAADLDPEVPVFVGEMNLTRLLEAPVAAARYRPVPRHPAVQRDLALLVDAAQGFAEIEAEIRAVDGERITGVEIFDRYAGDRLPRGKVSLAVRIEYQRPDRTLLREEVAALEQRILVRLRRRFGIDLRGPAAVRPAEVGSGSGGGEEET